MLHDGGMEGTGALPQTFGPAAARSAAYTLGASEMDGPGYQTKERQEMTGPGASTTRASGGEQSQRALGLSEEVSGSRMESAGGDGASPFKSNSQLKGMKQSPAGLFG